MKSCPSRSFQPSENESLVDCASTMSSFGRLLYSLRYSLLFLHFICLRGQLLDVIFGSGVAGSSVSLFPLETLAMMGSVWDSRSHSQTLQLPDGCDAHFISDLKLADRLHFLWFCWQRQVAEVIVGME